MYCSNRTCSTKCGCESSHHNNHIQPPLNCSVLYTSSPTPPHLEYLKCCSDLSVTSASTASLLQKLRVLQRDYSHCSDISTDSSCSSPSWQASTPIRAANLGRGLATTTVKPSLKSSRNSMIDLHCFLGLQKYPHL